MGKARGGVDCSSGDEGHLFIASITVAKIRRANVALVSTASSTHSTARGCRSPRMADP
jgi:hypothetical protein